MVVNCHVFDVASPPVDAAIVAVYPVPLASRQAGVNVPIVFDALYEIVPFTDPPSTHRSSSVDAGEVVATAVTFRLKVCELKIFTMSPVPVKVAETTEFTGTSAAPAAGITVTSAPIGGAAVPVPDSDSVVGEVAALLVIVRDPVSVPTPVGV